MDLQWQVLPYITYLLQPVFLCFGFPEIRVALPCHRMMPVASYRYELKPVKEEMISPPSVRSVSEEE